MDSNFNWLGSEVECYNKILEKQNNCKFYTCFMYNNQKYNIGDFVFYNNGWKEDRICRLMCVFESNNSWHPEKYRGMIRKYTRAKQLEPKCNVMRIKLDKENEVIEDFRDLCTSFLPLKKITKICHVIFATEDDPVYLIEAKKLDKNTYFSCRFKIVHDTIEPIFVNGQTVLDDAFLFTTTIKSPTEARSPQGQKRKSAIEREPAAVLNGERLQEGSPKKPKGGDVPQTSSPENKLSAVKRNLNNSFDDSSDESTPLLNYSLVNTSKNSEDALKIKLRVSKRKTLPVVIVQRLSPKIIESHLSKPTPRRTRRISFAATPITVNKTPTNDETPLRRSTRAQRKSYAEPISPEKFLRSQRGRTASVDSTKFLYASPSERPKRNVTTPKRYTFEDSSPKRAIAEVETPRKSKRLTRTPKNYQSSSESDSSLKTPKKSQPITPVRTYKDTPSRRAKLIREGIITPSVQRREKAVKDGNTPLMLARAQLHVSHVPEALPCRENEYSNVYNFLVGRLKDGCGGCMYISGVPGTGKTATVTAVIEKLQTQMQRKQVPKFDSVVVNGMRVTEPRQTYVEIVKQLTGKTVLWEQAQTILDTKFSKSKKSSLPLILLVDELDILCTRRQDVVYNLLDWPTKVNAQLIVVTIANTMDLPERLLMGRVTSRLGLTRLTFQPYSYKQLQEIVTKRLIGTESFNPDAVQLVARKVASVSGDARRALDICRRAAEIAETEGNPSSLVSMKHVNDALNAMITQPKVQAIKHSSKLEQLILQAVVAEVERTGVEETSFSDVYTMLGSIAALDGFQMVSRTVALGAVRRLSACRLLLTDQKSSDIFQKIILNVSADDVYYALRKDV